MFIGPCHQLAPVFIVDFQVVQVQLTLQKFSAVTSGRRTRGFGRVFVVEGGGIAWNGFEDLEGLEGLEALEALER